MLSRSRRAIAGVASRSLRGASAARHFGGAQTRTVEALEEVSEPFGEAYGAGPSRLPYQPPPSHSLPSAHRRTRDSARALRKALSGFDAGAFSQPSVLLKTLGLRDRRLSLLERHAILHFVLKTKPRLAVGLASELLDIEEKRPHRVFSQRTLSALGNPNLLPSALRRRAAHSQPEDGQPTIVQQRPTPISKHLQRLLDLLERLHDIRHPRPEALFKLAIEQCMRERRADLAANIYVGLVEEWIIEGRIAEGADPDDFYPGGGPPRTESKPKSGILALWFTGVRTWRLPGEALSPHDRLDLWHPRHMSTHDKLRGFPLPIPTSPPSLVPHPSLSFLYTILNNIEQDPKVVSPAEYAASMRALATLANTILSRTLPVPAVPSLLKAFSASRTFPVVYPASFDKEPESNAWAYTTNTQVHVALVSLMFSPPNYARATEIMDKFQEPKLAPKQDPLPPAALEGPVQYMLGPLGWTSSRVLLRYGLDQLKQPRLVTRLIHYMRKTWSLTSPRIFNEFFRSATRWRENAEVAKVENLLFGGSVLARTASDGQTELRTSPLDVSGEPINALVPAQVPEADANAPQADEHSLSALILHLTATSQFDRLEKLIYTVIPYLSVSSTTPQDQIDALKACVSEDALGTTGRILPTELSAHLYTVIVNGLAKGGFTGLAQRVYKLAKSFEDREIERDMEEGNGTPEAARYTLPIHMYTSMVEVYGGEARRAVKFEARSPRGWTVKDLPATVTRQQAGEVQVWRTYEEAMKRWNQLIQIHDRIERNVLLSCVPDSRFFNAVVRALRGRWALTSDDEIPSGRRAELQKLCNDMEVLGIKPPIGLVYKYKTNQANGRNIYINVDDDGITSPRPAPRRVYIPSRRALDRETRAKELNNSDTPSIA